MRQEDFPLCLLPWDVLHAKNKATWRQMDGQKTCRHGGESILNVHDSWSFGVALHDTTILLFHVVQPHTTGIVFFPGCASLLGRTTGAVHPASSVILGSLP
jgi:hypothetical protein